MHISVDHPPVLRITRNLIWLKEEKVITAKDSEGLAFALMDERQKEK
ncbi:unnamed protein product, partial [marine sediment metagenome]